jgi:hypothetical protein
MNGLSDFGIYKRLLHRSLTQSEVNFPNVVKLERVKNYVTAFFSKRFEGASSSRIFKTKYGTIQLFQSTSI